VEFPPDCGHAGPVKSGDILVARVGTLVPAASATLIQLCFRTHQARRTQFRHRQVSSSRIATFAEPFSSIAWAAASALTRPVPGSRRSWRSLHRNFRQHLADQPAGYSGIRRAIGGATKKRVKRLKPTPWGSHRKTSRSSAVACARKRVVKARLVAAPQPRHRRRPTHRTSLWLQAKIRL
jgi:hypothetical protein